MFQNYPLIRTMLCLRRCRIFVIQSESRGLTTFSFPFCMSNINFRYSSCRSTRSPFFTTPVFFRSTQCDMHRQRTCKSIFIVVKILREPLTLHFEFLLMHLNKKITRWSYPYSVSGSRYIVVVIVPN